MFDKAAAPSASAGVYIVYLFSEDGKHLYLTLSIGGSGYDKKNMAPQEMLAVASAISNGIEDKGGFKDLIAPGSLGSDSKAKNYEIGVALSKEYNLSSLPSDEDMIKDLQKLCTIYRAYLDGHEDGEPQNTGEGQNGAVHQITSFSRNTIFYGAPGTGKTYHTVNQAVAICENKSLETINKDYPVRDDLTKRYRKLLGSGHISFVTFHQSYTYEDFVIGIFPDFKSGSLNYVTKSGSFKRLCDLAKEDPEHNYVMIIDEINRGNISKIFGELITLIEDSKRIGGSEETEAVLPYPDEKGWDKFAVPENVYIIGTMNTADRSIQHVDTALRRRFVFTEMVPNAALFHDLYISDGSKTINLEELLNGINKRIKRYYDREHVIGHAYFIEMLKEGLNDKEKLTLLASIFHDKIIPLLQDYFFEDYSKIQKVLGEEEDTDEGKSLIRKLSNEPSDEEDEGHDVYEIAPVGDPAYDNLDTYLLMIEK